MLKKIGLLLITLIACGVVFVGCGDASSNDQGTSFTFLGWYEKADPEAEPTLLTGLTLNLNSLAVNNIAGKTAYAGFTNHLYGEAIRLQRVHLKFEVPGSKIEIPSTAAVLNTILGPRPDNGSGAFDQDSSLPDSFGDGTGAAGEDFAPTSYGEVFIVPAEIMSFLSLNKASLPQTPFTLVVTAYGSAITTAGKQLNSNEIQFAIFVSDEVDIPTIGGSGAGAGDAGAESTSESPTTTPTTASNGDASPTDVAPDVIS